MINAQSHPEGSAILVILTLYLVLLSVKRAMLRAAKEDASLLQITWSHAVII